MPTPAFPRPGTPASRFGRGVRIFDTSRPPAIIARQIDPTTGDVATLFGGLHPTDAAIQYQFSVEEVSGSAVHGGHRFAKIRKATDAAPAELKNEALRLMEPFVAAGDAEVEAVRAFTDGDIGVVEVEYWNLRTGEKRQVRG